MMNTTHIDLSGNNNFLPSLSVQEKCFISKEFINIFRFNSNHPHSSDCYVKLQNQNLTNRKNPLDDLRSKICFAEGVESSLVERVDVLTLLTTVISKIVEYFPTDTSTFFLRKSYDSNSNAFVLEVQSRQDYDEAKQAFEDFDDDWWLDHMPPSDDVLIIGLSTL